MSEVKNHDYHIIDPSPLPIMAAAAAFVMAIGAVMFMHDGGPWVLLAGTAGVLYAMFAWWKTVIAEGEGGVDHTPAVSHQLRMGMILFIASEVMFFVAWFWAYFNVSLFPGDVIQEARHELIGGVWPPTDIATFNPWGLPFINTVILLTSGATLTWAHHGLQNNDYKTLKIGLVLTIALGALFTCLQAYEYSHAGFGFSEHIYGSTFYMATGFHGFHVIVGTLFLMVMLWRAMKGHFKPEQHVGFESAAWYWHFVDVVWLFLFAVIYVWGAGASTAAGH